MTNTVTSVAHMFIFFVHVIRDDLTTCQLYCQLCCGLCHVKW